MYSKQDQRARSLKEKKPSTKRKPDKSVQEELVQVRREFEVMRSLLSKSLKKLDEYICLSGERLGLFEMDLMTIKKTNESAEETLLNVLAAIRQNEYLQAWAPPQHGFPEMKISGIHPAKLTKKL